MSRAAARDAFKPVKFTAKDRALLNKDPEEGLKRIRAKAQANAIMAMAAYTGASKSRRQFGNWSTSGGDADADTIYDLPTLRERSRDMNRNNPLAAGAINTKVTNVVGTGLALKSAIDRDFLGLSEDEAEEWQRNTEREFTRFWAESANASVERDLDFYGLQELAFRSVLENGDCLALPLYLDRPGVVYSLTVQLIEADRICNEGRTGDTDRLVAGVEKDEAGAPVRYHVMNQHPGALRYGRNGGTWSKVAAFTDDGRRNALHLYRKLRIGQTRGVPDLAPVISALKQLGDYTEAELTAALVSGLFTVFIKTADGETMPTGLSTDVTNSNRADTESVSMGAGAVVGLADGESIETANPGRPNTAFDPFVMAILRQVGVALELPFEVLVMHFQSSYSAARAALLQAWKFFRQRRVWLAASFCQPIYEAWMWEAVAMGRIKAPGFLQDPAIRAAYLGSEWIGDAPGALDPLKEGQAAALYEDRGWKTGTENTAELTGGDWEAKHRQLTREARLRREAGLGAQQSLALSPPDATDETDDEAVPARRDNRMEA